YSSEDLNNAKGVNLKGIADKQCNNYSVSEAAALLAVGDNARLLLDKYSEEDVTISIAGGLE
ncbi:MAG: cobalamin biosynthesis protein, partial [Lentisphaeria bacterium]